MNGKFQTAWCLSNGKGTYRNLAEAKDWCEKAATGGHANAAKLLAAIEEAEDDESAANIVQRKASTGLLRELRNTVERQTDIDAMATADKQRFADEVRVTKAIPTPLCHPHARLIAPF